MTKEYCYVTALDASSDSKMTNKVVNYNCDEMKPLLKVFVRVELVNAALYNVIDLHNETLQSLVEFLTMSAMSTKALSDNIFKYTNQCRVCGYEIRPRDKSNEKNCESAEAPKSLAAPPVAPLASPLAASFQYERPIPLTVFLSSIGIEHPVALSRFELLQTANETSVDQTSEMCEDSKQLSGVPNDKVSAIYTQSSHGTLVFPTHSFWMCEYPNHVWPNLVKQLQEASQTIAPVDVSTATSINSSVKPSQALIQEMLAESKEDDNKHKHWAIKSLVDYKFSDWSNELFQSYFSETNVYRNFPREPTLAKIVSFRRYGMRTKFLFECVFRHPERIKQTETSLKTNSNSSSTSASSSTNSKNTITVWLSYNQLISNPRYRDVLKSKYHWDMNEAKDKYESGCDSDVDEDFEKYIETLDSDNEDGTKKQQNTKSTTITSREPRLQTRIYSMESRKLLRCK